MFTKNNYVLVKSSKWGEEYKKVQINKLKKADQVLSCQLPQCQTSFPVDIESVDVCENRNMTTAYKLNIVNSIGHKYELEVTMSPKEAFVRYSKFKRLENIIAWYQNYALVDWLGLPCKITSVELVEYDGPIYDLVTKDSNNYIVSGLVFHSESFDENGDPKDDFSSQSE